jgi:hypothetical protein
MQCIVLTEYVDVLTVAVGGVCVCGDFEGTETVGVLCTCCFTGSTINFPELTGGQPTQQAKQVGSLAHLQCTKARRTSTESW